MIETLKYIYKDILAAWQLVPLGIAVGIPMTMIVMSVLKFSRKGKTKTPVKKIAVFLFCIFLSMMLALTLFSRESGSRTGWIDLGLFSTWGINARNNAYVIENVLLFIPFGTLVRWNFERIWNCFACAGIGFLSSLAIETIQLLTGRGFFQIDDILTNTLGTVIGLFLYALCKKVFVKLITENG